MKNNYNERSWAIDVITEINLIVTQRKKTIRKAGGERTLKASTKSSSLFPDVLLFQDETSLRTLQGWELKMPDTPINDRELISNATKKALLLGLNSFLLWNVSEADLYIQENGIFVVKKHWHDLADITRRDEVEPQRSRWVALIGDILTVLEDFFNSGEIQSQNITSTLSESNIIDVITNNAGLVQQNIRQATVVDAMLKAAIDEWWETIKIEYSSEPNAIAAVSKLILITWINRFLFTHYLKKFTNKALEIDDFTESTTLDEANQFFTELTTENDFLNVYAPVLGEHLIDTVSWDQILQLNSFLSDLQLQYIDQGLLQQFFEKLLLVSKRKSAGQYATPYPLADYLTRIVIMDLTKDVLDPFCGTGTILRATYDLKETAGIAASDIIDSIWGSDKFSFPLQMTTLSLARPEVMGKVINIFKSDVKDLEVSKSFDFVDPNTGTTIAKDLPQFDYIISNLPFVQAAHIANSNPDIRNIVSKIATLLGEPRFDVSTKSDIIAYLPYYLWFLLKDGGRVGLIVSNAWLGTSWGDEFRRSLNRFFKITQVVTSANGKWFTNAQVITNLLVLDKRTTPVSTIPANEETSFVSIIVPLSDFENRGVVSQAARQTLLKRNGSVTVKTIRKDKMDELQINGLGLSAYFADLDWFDTLKTKLVKASSLFKIGRGERRGWDAMFFPGANHGIEPQFIQPVLENLRTTAGLVAVANGDAFCCSKTIQELTDDGDVGALNWISRFQHGVNGVGIPLPQSLARARHHWYEMKTNTAADLIAQINYGKTLVIAKLQQRSFVNQRLISFTANTTTIDIDLCHALMNSYAGLYFIEALGFGRGQGALDLSSTKLKDHYSILDPNLLTHSDILAIKTSFTPLLNRPINNLPFEVTLSDRMHFEYTVASVYGFTAIWDNIRDSLLNLYNIRNNI